MLQIISLTKMSANEVPGKLRRQKPDVPIHRNTEHCEKHKKSFSANFNSKHFKNANPHHTEIIVEIPESDRCGKPRRKQLMKENVRLTNDNKELLDKYQELEDLSVRKITKLKEKIGSLQLANAEINQQNAELKLQCETLLISYEDITKQLELKSVCQNCKQLKKTIDALTSDNNSMKTKNNELSVDLNMLKTVIYRLNVQLERYQETLRKNKIVIPITNSSMSVKKRNLLEDSEDEFSKEIFTEVHRSHKHTPLSWGSVHSHTLGPLLDAYEDTIKEKEEIIENYEGELSNFTGKLKDIILENEHLYEKLTEDEGCSSKLKIELEKLKQELKGAREQNDVLIKKCAMKQDKVEEILKIYEAKVSQMKRDFDVLHGEYMRYRTENAALQEKNKCFLDSQEELKDQMHNFIPISVHTASVNECKKWYEELKSQYENEKHKLSNNIEQQSKTIEGLKNEIDKLKKAKDGLEVKVVQQEKHIKKMEAKHLEVEHMLNQVQLSRSALKKQLHKAMNFAKDMVSEQESLLKTLNQKQIENKVVKKMGADMASRMDSLKSQLKDVQRSAWQEFSTVEQTIQQQSQLIDTMKEEHVKEIEKLKKIIQEREEANVLLNNENLPMQHYYLFKDKYSS